MPDPIEAPTPVDYFMPDLKDGATAFDNKAFNLRVGFAVLADYHFIGQDPISLEQVGPQASVFDLRAGRILVMGRIKFKKPWFYVFSADYDEKRNRGDRVFDILDLAVTIPLWKKSRITIGKQKEPFIFEMVAVAAFLPHQERLLNPFFTSRNIGVRYTDNYFKDRMSFSVGVYNDWFRSGLKLHESGTQVSGRVTGLPIYSKDRRTFLHLGLGLRYNGADQGTMRFTARPESNVTDYYADTGNLAATHATQFALEAFYNKRSFSVIAEYTRAWIAAPTRGNPSFNGSYVTVSYFLTGDTRPYDKYAANILPIIPKSRWGAVELVGRVGYVDLDDGFIKGGKLTTWYAGANWWASKQWKIGMGYGLADLDRFNLSGRTHRFITRVQWIY
jgi:phosphate-selective porin OprO and OprP